MNKETRKGKVFAGKDIGENDLEKFMYWGLICRRRKTLTHDIVNEEKVLKEILKERTVQKRKLKKRKGIMYKIQF